VTAATMEEWLNMFNAKMKKENRNAIRFLDNATCCPNITLSNAHGYGCYLYIQIALQMICDAIFDFDCRKKPIALTH
jgi:hypothetical protein